MFLKPDCVICFWLEPWLTQELLLKVVPRVRPSKCDSEIGVLMYLRRAQLTTLLTGNEQR